MGRTIGIDFGLKRVGMAVTDPLGISVQGHGTYNAETFEKYLQAYLSKEEVERIVIGMPSAPSDKFSSEVTALAKRLKESNQDLEVVFHDEDFSSKAASELLSEMGVKRSKRKQAIDQASAIVILQDYLGMRRM